MFATRKNSKPQNKQKNKKGQLRGWLLSRREKEEYFRCLISQPTMSPVLGR